MVKISVRYLDFGFGVDGGQHLWQQAADKRRLVVCSGVERHQCYAPHTQFGIAQWHQQLRHTAAQERVDRLRLPEHVTVTNNPEYTGITLPVYCNGVRWMFSRTSLPIITYGSRLSYVFYLILGTSLVKNLNPITTQNAYKNHYEAYSEVISLLNYDANLESTMRSIRVDDNEHNFIYTNNRRLCINKNKCQCR